MAYKICIASGKGGTGKTTIAVNLYHFFSAYITDKVQLVDCDVEEPNDSLFFHEKKLSSTEEITREISSIDIEKCNFCKKCLDYCEFNAISIINRSQQAEINNNLCHFCKACSYVCPNGAIKTVTEKIGVLNQFSEPNANGLLEGKLKIGSAMQTELIKKIKDFVDPTNKIIIYDSPPGTSCPVVATIVDVDYVILVTEPTPFGLHDLKLAIDVVNELHKSFGVIINKAYLNFAEMNQYLESKNIDVLAKIPYLKDYAYSYAEGKILQDKSQDILLYYYPIIERVKEFLENE